MESFAQRRTSPWPHRLTVALALVTFPLIWVGGLVTTYDAGMAVPDWPGTYGYNLFLYPWQTWLSGPWDLFIEHGHRLLGAGAGLLSIGLVVAVLVTDRRSWLIAAAIGALVLVIVQGLLGGARVVFDARLIALIHGCVGPLYFGYLAVLVVASSRWWASVAKIDSDTGSRLARAAWTAAGLAYFQLIVGAVVRHVPLAASPQVFRAALWLHLIVAGLLMLQVAVTSWRAWRTAREGSGAHRGNLRTPGILLSLLVGGQLVLGAATYIAKYSWPGWFATYQFAAGYVVQERGLFQSLITTAHVANGSLILFAAVVLAMRSSRLFLGAGSLPAFWTGWQPALSGRAA
jgi:heme a synthase